MKVAPRAVMAKRRVGILVGGVLLAAAAISVGACGGDEDMTEPPSGAGAGGGGGEQPGDGRAGSAQAGASAGQAGAGGSAAQGGEAACIDRLRIVKIIEESPGNIISWPTENRVGLHVNGQISIYELGGDGAITLVEALGPEALGLGTEGSISALTRYGHGFLVQGSTGPEPRVARIAIWQPNAELETVPLPEPQPAWLHVTAADAEVGIAAATRDGIGRSRRSRPVGSGP